VGVELLTIHFSFAKMFGQRHQYTTQYGGRRSFYMDAIVLYVSSGKYNKHVK